MVPGGWYDAGDTLKLNFPGATAASAIGWGLIDFKEGYERFNLLNRAKDTLKVQIDYLYNCLDMENGTYIGAIGIAYIDHNYWGRPFQQPADINRRPAIYNSSMAAADLYGAVSAALSTGNLIYKSSDPLYAENLKKAAIYLYEWGSRTGGRYSAYYKDVTAATYPSGDEYDHLALAAGWLYRVTGDSKYLTEAFNHWSKDTPNIFGRWDSVWGSHAAHMVSLADQGVSVPGIDVYRSFMNKYFREWVDLEGQILKTPLGMAYPRWSKWGNLAYSTTAAAITSISAKYTKDLTLKTKLLAFAKEQVDYALGSGRRSYVVGYGYNPPDQPHHAAASCPDLPAPCGWSVFSSPDPNGQVITGALVAGPGGQRVNPIDPDNSFVNQRTDYVTNEVSVDYNAGFTTALAAACELYNL